MRAHTLFPFLSIFMFLPTAQAQFLIDQEFNGGATPPAGWTFTSITSTTTAANCGRSSPALVFNATNDRVVTGTWALGDQITFTMRATAAPTTDRMRVEVFNGTTWSVLADVRPHQTATTTCLSIGTNITQARFTFTKGAANVNFDDVSVRLSESCGQGGVRIRFINVDGCSSGCEGRDEFFTFTTGGTPVSVSDIEFTYPDANNSAVTWCGTSANAPCDNYLSINPAAVNTLNTLAGCVRFISPGTSIPANSNVIVFNGNPQSSVTDFTSLCASSVMYYAVFANNTDCNGRFGNYQTGGDTYRGLFLRDRGTGCTDTASYRRDNVGLSNGSGGSVDGASVLFNGAATYVLTNCLFAVLPIELVTFTAEPAGVSVAVEWVTATEHDNDRFVVERSADGAEFEEIGTVPGAGTSLSTLSYAFLDEHPLAGMAYYRLAQVDFNGTVTHGPIATVSLAPAEVGRLSAYPDPFRSGVDLSPLPGMKGMVRFRVVDGQGHTVYEEERHVATVGERIHLELGGLRSGAHWLIAWTDTDRYCTKLVKE